MEIHRLVPMKDNYPTKLFNKLYYDTRKLRKKLASQIDSRRFGVSDDIIESWFDDKFIFVFNKYFTEKEPNILKGFIINSLQVYKYRILRKAYSKEGQYYQSLVELEGEKELINIIPDSSTLPMNDLFKDLMYSFMENALTDDANLLFKLELNPPPYFLNRLNKSNSHIPNNLLLNFLDLDNSNINRKYITQLRNEIKTQIKMAKEYFEEHPEAISIA